MAKALRRRRYRSLYTLEEMRAWLKVPARQRLLCIEEMAKLRASGVRGKRLKDCLKLVLEGR